ncbi:hypothetical protein lerEdw1_008532, partial [Lerista edwardsae]
MPTSKGVGEGHQREERNTTHTYSKKAERTGVNEDCLLIAIALFTAGMEFLCVKVKRGRLQGAAAESLSTYVVLNVQNVKSLTTERQGNEPCWEQDFMFEISGVEKGFAAELWSKGWLWDRFLGAVWIPLTMVEYATDEGPGVWWTLDTEVVKKGKASLPHKLLLDAHIALLT